MINKARFFYGWVIVCVTIMGMILIYGIRHSLAVFFSPILAGRLYFRYHRELYSRFHSLPDLHRLILHYFLDRRSKESNPDRCGDKKLRV